LKHSASAQRTWFAANLRHDRIEIYFDFAVAV
jgi:hypothetical protein